MAPVVFAELAEAEARVVVEVFGCTEEGLAVVGEVAVLQLVAEGHKEDTLQLLARMPMITISMKSNGVEGERFKSEGRQRKFPHEVMRSRQLYVHPYWDHRSRNKRR